LVTTTSQALYQSLGYRITGIFDAKRAADA